LDKKAVEETRMEKAGDTPLKSQLVLSVLPLIHSWRGSLEIVALVGDIIAADARLNIWACEVERRAASIERWKEIVKFFEDAEAKCLAAVRKFEEGGDRTDLADALRGVLVKLNERPDPTFDWSAFSRSPAAPTLDDETTPSPRRPRPSASDPGPQRPEGDGERDGVRGSQGLQTYQRGPSEVPRKLEAPRGEDFPCGCPSP
jgi:hypothetical protein